MGAPPHGGFAMGLDRLIMLLAGEANIREVTPFPKVSSGSDPMTGAPTPLAETVQRDLGIRVVAPQ
jgi:aspartyl-tRNA synthetase